MENFTTVAYNIATELNASVEERAEIESGGVVEAIWKYVTPIIFIVGICGNMLVIAVMRRKPLRGSTTCVYLPLIAVADSATLITGIIPDWMDFMGLVVFKEISQWTCKFEKFLFYTSSDVAVWLLVAFTFDRFVAVTFPLKKRMVCVPKRAKIAGLALLVVGLIKNFHVFWSRGSVYDEEGDLLKNCGQPEPYTYFEKFVRPWIALTLVTIIPFSFLFICNCVIIRTLTRARNQQLKNSKGAERSSVFTQTTLMCLSASFTFLICVSPSIVLLIGKPYWTSENTQNTSYLVVKSISNQLSFINHSINFFLYCLTGERFRLELIAMFCGKKKKRMESARFQYTKKVNNKVKRASTMKRKFSLEISSVQTSREGSEERENGDTVISDGNEKYEVTRETTA